MMTFWGIQDFLIYLAKYFSSFLFLLIWFVNYFFASAMYKTFLISFFQMLIDYNSYNYHTF